jgi:hypothetical protein
MRNIQMLGTSVHVRMRLKEKSGDISPDRVDVSE